MVVVGHDVDPVANRCDCWRIDVGDLGVTGRSCNGEVIGAAVDSGLAIQFITQGLQEKQVVAAVSRGVADAGLRQPTTAWILPVDINAIEAVLGNHIDGGLCKVCTLLCTARDGEERR